MAPPLILSGSSSLFKILLNFHHFISMLWFHNGKNESTSCICPWERERGLIPLKTKMNRGNNSSTRSQGTHLVLRKSQRYWRSPDETGNRQRWKQQKKENEACIHHFQVFKNNTLKIRKDLGNVLQNETC